MAACRRAVVGGGVPQVSAWQAAAVAGLLASRSILGHPPPTSLNQARYRPCHASSLPSGCDCMGGSMFGMIGCVHLKAHPRMPAVASMTAAVLRPRRSCTHGHITWGGQTSHTNTSQRVDSAGRKPQTTTRMTQQAMQAGTVRRRRAAQPHPCQLIAAVLRPQRGVVGADGEVQERGQHARALPALGPPALQARAGPGAACVGGEGVGGSGGRGWKPCAVSALRCQGYCSPPGPGCGLEGGRGAYQHQTAAREEKVHDDATPHTCPRASC